MLGGRVRDVFNVELEGSVEDIITEEGELKAHGVPVAQETDLCHLESVLGKPFLAFLPLDDLTFLADSFFRSLLRGSSLLGHFLLCLLYGFFGGFFGRLLAAFF